MCSLLERVLCGSWRTRWGADDIEGLKSHYPPRHSDYRDHTPEQLEDIYRLYQPVVQPGRWTEGLIEMWFWKHKPVKAAVHIPCWDAFKWNPLRWRGPCFGRTFEECYWTGLRQMRWARGVYAANLGREYVMPVRNIGRHGYKSDIKALCWMYCLMGCLFGCGIGQLFTLCGNFLCNFASCYSCHARERLRRRYGLPPTFCLPPGIDDCLVHFFCFYCASHQELRELAVRGIDGPGMHILDVLPRSFPNAPDIDKAVAERRAVRQRMLGRPPKMFRARAAQGATRLRQQLAEVALKLADAAPAAAPGSEADGEEAPDLVPLDARPSGAGSEAASDSSAELGGGWHSYCPPHAQEMRRGGTAADLAPAPATAPSWQQEARLREWLGSEEQQQRRLQQLRSGQRHPSEQQLAVLEEEWPGQLQAMAPRRWSVAY